jgi:hypothetical protein
LGYGCSGIASIKATEAVVFVKKQQQKLGVSFFFKKSSGMLSGIERIK